MAVNEDIIHGPRVEISLTWFRCPQQAVPCIVQLHVQTSEIVDVALCLFNPLVKFCSFSELMQTIYIFVNISIIVDTVPVETLQRRIPVVAAKIFQTRIDMTAKTIQARTELRAMTTHIGIIRHNGNNIVKDEIISTFAGYSH